MTHPYSHGRHFAQNYEIAIHLESLEKVNTWAFRLYETWFTEFTKFSRNRQINQISKLYLRNLLPNIAPSCLIAMQMYHSARIVMLMPKCFVACLTPSNEIDRKWQYYYVIWIKCLLENCRLTLFYLEQTPNQNQTHSP